MLHALRRTNPKQSTDRVETESISCQAWRVFVTVWLFIIIGGLVEEPHWRAVLSSPSCRRKLQRVASSHFDACCCFEEVVLKLKDPYLKFCRALASRVRIAVAEFRVNPEDESHSTTAKVLPRLLMSYTAFFRFGLSWLTLLPLQILRTYNNQSRYPLLHEKL